MATLHYTESGQGDPLFLLHSGGMSGAEWKPQIPLGSVLHLDITPKLQIRSD